ncbi:hypothetical protein B566_EDAN000867 [Ephemera danica]|nr:hypothetical protein B566_EDAN000867 [Ephemera danica]
MLVKTQVGRSLQQQSAAEFTVEELHGTGNSSTFPYFDFNVPRNVTTAVGQTAFLHCRVEQLGDKAAAFITRGMPSKR